MEGRYSHPLSSFIYFERRIGSHTHSHAHAHTCAPDLAQLQAGTRPRRTPTLQPQAPPPLPTHPPSTWAQPGAKRPRCPPAPRCPRCGREGAALGSDGQSGRPMEPGTAFPEGGRRGSDGPNERGARVGLPPGTPLARIAGLWVTRKLGGRRRRRPRLRSPVSDSGPPSPKPGRAPRPHGHPDPAGRAPRRRREPGSFCRARTPSFGWQQSRAVGTAARGRGAARAGLPSAAAGPKSGEQATGRARAGIGRDTPRRSMRGAPSRAPALAESQPRKSSPAAAPAASMAARPAARGG